MNYETEIAKHEKRVRNAASWYFFAAVLSAVNCIGIIFSWNYRFIVGFASSDIVASFISVFSEEGIISNQAITILLYIMVILVSLSVIGILGIFISKQKLVAAIIGTVIMTLDTILFFVFAFSGEPSMFIDIAFHAWMVISSAIAINSITKLPRLREEQMLANQNIVAHDINTEENSEAV